MKYSENVLLRSEQPKFIYSESSLKGALSVELKDGKFGDITLFYDVHKSDEIYINNLTYQTEIKASFLGALDYYCELINGKPYEVINRIGLKELDFFIRGSSKKPSFVFYSAELYELLTLGEKIYKSLNQKKNKVLTFCVSNMDDMPMTEQIEYFEEFLSVHIYPEFQGIELDFEDFSDGKLILRRNFSIDDKGLKYITDTIHEHLGLNRVGVKLEIIS